MVCFFHSANNELGATLGDSSSDASIDKDKW